MAKTTFANGTVVTSAFLNAINNPVFVDTPDDDGEIAKITKADLSTTAGQILPEWQAFRDELKVTAGTGLNADYAAGVVTLATGARQAIAAGSVGLTASTTNWVFVNDSGAVAASTSVPLIGVVLASVVTTSTVVSAVIDRRPRFEVKPIQESIKLIGGNGGDGSFATGVVSGTNPSGLTNITLDREVYYFSSFTVNSGHTVTLSSGLTRIYCSGAVTINGTLTGSVFLRGGPNNGEGGFLGSGDGYRDDLTGLGIGANRGQVYSWEAQPYGSSGGGPNFNLQGTSQSVTITGGAGGAGGAGLFIEASGPIAIGAAGIINANGGNAAIGTINNAWLRIGPGAGGSGGIVHLSSLISISNAGVINVRGGDGAAGQRGASVTAGVLGGRAGGGGWAVFIAPTITPGTVNGSAGSNGATVGGADPYPGSSGASFAGRGGNARTPFDAAESGQIVTRTIKPVA